MTATYTPPVSCFPTIGGGSVRADLVESIRPADYLPEGYADADDSMYVGATLTTGRYVNIGPFTDDAEFEAWRDRFFPIIPLGPPPEDEPFVRDAGEWLPGVWGGYPERIHF